MNNAPARSRYHLWIVASCCALMTASIAIPLTCASAFFPAVSAALGVGKGEIGLTITIQSVVMALLLPVAGRILSRCNVRVVFTAAMIVYAVGMATMSLHETLWPFYLSSVVLGVGGAFFVYLAVPILINHWFRAKVGMAMGFSYAFAGIGGMIFSPITGHIIATYGWRTAYVFLGAAMLVIALPFTIFVVRGKPEEIGLQPYGAEAAQPGQAAAPLAGMTRAEAFKTGNFYLMCAFAGFLGIGAGMLYQVSNFMVSLGYGIEVAAKVLAAGTAGVTIGKFGVGWLNDKIGLRPAAGIGILTGAAGVLLMLFAGHAGLGVLYVGCVMLGVSYACTALEPPILVRAVFGSKEYSQIFSVIMIFSAMGTAFGTSLLGFVSDVTGNFNASLGLVAVLLVAAFGISQVVLRGVKTAGAGVPATVGAKH